MKLRPHRRPRSRTCRRSGGARVGVDRIEVDRWPLDGVAGLHGRVSLNESDLVGLGSFKGGKTMAVIAFMPRLVLLDDPWGTGDEALILDLCPTDYTARSWVWIIEQGARRLLQTEEFHAAFGAARDRIAAEA